MKSRVTPINYSRDHSPRWNYFKWHPALDEAVNKRDLSTGETGESVRKTGGAGSALGLRSASWNLCFQNERDGTHKYLRNVWPAERVRNVGCQQKRRCELELQGSGSPGWIRITFPCRLGVGASAWRVAPWSDSSRLLLSHAMQGSQAEHQVAAGNADDFAIRK
jgi:hypothetical protein